eukprot:UN26694
MKMDMEDPWRKKIVKQAAQVWVDQTYSHGGGEEERAENTVYSKPSKPTPKGKEIKIMDLRDDDEEKPPPEDDAENDDFLDDIFSPKSAPVKKKPKPEVKQEKSDFDMEHIEAQLKVFMKSKDLEKCGSKELVRQFQQEIGVQFPKPVRKQVKKMVQEIALDQMRSQVLEESQKFGSAEPEKQD